MNHVVFNLIFFTLNILFSSKTNAQQNYSGNSILTCKNTDEKGPSPAFLYTCNGLNKSCMNFLIFKSNPPYNSITTISNLTSSNPNELARINGATIFPPGKEVIVPVNCSCLTKDYYQAETKYILGSNPTYFTVANDTFQGLTTCDSLMRANKYGELDLLKGMVLNVPLRCACPTYHQKTKGIKYLVTYSVTWGDNISNIATRFNVAVDNLLDANGFSTETEVLFPFTTVLIPLPSEPVNLKTIVAKDPPTPIDCSFKKCKSKSKVLLIALTTSVLILCVFLFVVFLLLFLLRKRSTRFLERCARVANRKGVSSEEIREEIAIIEHLSKVYIFEEIKVATENFSSKNKIEGSLFRGVFGKGKEVLAVKRMRGDASKEVNLLKKINHFNLIKLQGYCEYNDCLYLVYEYMENGSLREWLSKNKSIEHQSWAKRIQIALDIANGLQYLHNFTEPCYVHKDINSGNILLNKDLRAKIAKFARAEESKKMLTSCTTSRLGSNGYLAPEYVKAGEVSTKMDVYAFGVVLLELITGKDSITLTDGREVMLNEIIENIIGKENEEEKVSLFIDPCLTGNCTKACALPLVKLSLACLIQEPERRPNIAEVVSSLLKIQANDMQQRMSPIINKSLSLER